MEVKRMKKAKRRIVALATSITMAFVLVAAMVPATVSKAVANEKYIYPDGFVGIGAEGEADAHGNYMANIPGTSEYTSIEKGDGNTIIFTDLTINGGDGTGISFYSQDAWTFRFVGTNSMNMIMCDGSGDLNVSVSDNSTLTLGKVVGGFVLADGTTADKDISNASMDNPIENVTLSGPSGGDDPSPTPDPDTPSVPVKDGYADQTVASGSAITIGFDTAITNFVNGTEQGLVYIDGTKVPPQYITATEGSTIITVSQEYLSQLAEGAHKMVVKFLDGTEGEASFTISSSAAASADGTTASSGTASSTVATTTTKATAAKTADALPYAGLALVFVGASAIGVIAYRRKNS